MAIHTRIVAVLHIVLGTLGMAVLLLFGLAFGVIVISAPGLFSFPWGTPP